MKVLLLSILIALIPISSYAQCGATLTPTDPASCATSDGTINFSVPTGTPPYQYSIDGGTTYINSGVPPNYTFTGLSAGTYTTVVLDGSACTSFVDVTLSGGSTVTYVAAITDATCGNSDGSIILTASGGTSYTYSIDNGITSQATGAFNGLASGTYDILITDVSGCSTTGSETVGNGSTLTLDNLVATDPNCSGATDGTISFFASGGTGTLSYSIDNGATYSATSVFTLLASGTYNCIVQDANGCTVSTSVTLTDPSSVSTEIGAWMLNLTGHLADYETPGYVQTTDSSDVKTVCYDANNIYVRAEGMANYTMGPFTANPNSPAAQDWTFKIPRNPIEEVGTKTSTPFGGAEALAINGVVLFGYGDGRTYSSANNNNDGAGDGVWDCDAWVSEGITMDASGGGHPTGNGIYHYHATPFTLYSVTNTGHSPIVGYSLDGFPIYGPFGYTTALDNTSAVIRMSSGFELRNITTRTTLPSGAAATPNGPAVSATFPLGTYIQDYEFTGNGTLDEYNGRYCVTPEYPGGIYAYFLATDIVGDPAFPYILGAEYYGVVSNADVLNAGNETSPGGLTCWDGLAGTALSYSASVSNASCGASDGSVTLVGSGGNNSSYQYGFDGGALQASGTFSGQAEGTYQVVIEDGSGCQIIDNITIANPAAPVLNSESSIDPLCNGGTGSITMTASGGTGSLTYSIDGGITTQASGTFSGLAGGTYSVLVEDINGCQVSTSALTISVPAAIAVNSETSTNPLCNGSTGSITMTASGGTGSLVYSIDGGITTQGTGTFSGLASGTYTVLVEDVNGCQVSTSALTISVPSAVTVNTETSTNPLCNGSTGSIAMTASGGTGSLTYSIDGGITTQATGNFSGLASGTYTVLVEDVNGCQVSTSALTISVPAAIAINSEIATSPLCNGSTGSITMTASGGTGSLTYSIDGGITTQGSGTFSGLTDGTYTVLVEDINGCQVSTSTLTISVPTAIVINTQTSTNASCANNDGTITLSASGGTSSLTYSIDGGITSQATGNFTNLVGGTYPIVIEDVNGCQVSSSIVVSNVNAPVVNSEVVTSPLCNGGTGSIAMTASGGTGSLTYSIDGGITTQASGNFSGLTSGTYTVLVEDVNGCQVSTSTLTISVPTPVTVNSEVATSPLCYGGTGSITMTASGGIGSLTYSIDGGITTQGSGTFSGLADGTYTVLVEDINGCQVSTSTLTISVPSAIAINSQASTDASCSNNDGTITLSASGGTSSLTYSIDGGLSSQATGNFINLIGGTYSIVIEDANGCQISSSIVVSNVNAPVVNSEVTTNPLCYGGTGSIAMTASGGTGSLTYSIDGGITTQGSGTFSGLADGTYTVLVEDINGCQVSTSTLTISVPSAIVIDSQNSTDAACANDDGTITLSASGGTPSLTYSIDGGLSSQATGNFTNLVGGTYSIVIEDVNGCQATSVETISTIPSMSATAVITNEVISNDGAIDLTVTGGTPPFLFDWDNDGTGDTDDPEDLTNLAAGTYAVTIYDDNGCSFDTLFTVEGNVGINELAISISLFPNPVENELTISTSSQVNFDFEIIDAFGKLVLKGDYEHPIDVNSLAPGVYFVQLNIENNIITKRFQKVN